MFQRVHYKIEFITILVIISLLTSCANHKTTHRRWVPHEKYSTDNVISDKPYSGLKKIISPHTDFDQIILDIHSDNFQLKKAKLNILLTKIESNVQKGHQKPSLNLSINTQKQYQQGVKAGNKTTDNNQFSLNSSWEIDLWKKVKREWQQSLIQVDIQKEEYEALRESIIWQCFKEYLNIHSLKQIESILEKRLQLEKKIKVILNEDFVQLNTQFNKIQEQENKIISIQQELIQNSREQKSSHIFLNFLLGKSKATEHRISNYLDISEWQKSLDHPKIGIPTQLIENRIDIKVASLEIDKHILEWENKQRALYPNLTIQATLGSREKQWKNLIDPGYMFSNLSTQILQPIFNNGNLRKQKKLSKIVLEQNLLHYAHVYSNAILEVESHLNDFFKEKEKLNMLNQQIKNIKVLKHNQDKNYASGLTSLRVLIQLDLQLNHMQENKIHLLKTQIQYHYSLLNALGSRWHLKGQQQKTKSSYNLNK